MHLAPFGRSVLIFLNASATTRPKVVTHPSITHWGPLHWQKKMQKKIEGGFKNYLGSFTKLNLSWRKYFRIELKTNIFSQCRSQMMNGAMYFLGGQQRRRDSRPKKRKRQRQRQQTSGRQTDDAMQLPRCLMPRCPDGVTWFVISANSRRTSARTYVTEAELRRDQHVHKWNPVRLLVCQQTKEKKTIYYAYF